MHVALKVSWKASRTLNRALMNSHCHLEKGYTLKVSPIRGQLGPQDLVMEGLNHGRLEDWATASMGKQVANPVKRRKASYKDSAILDSCLVLD